MAGNAKLLAFALDRRPTLTFQRVFPDIDVSRLEPRDILAQLLKDWKRDEETLVLSAENLRPRHAGMLRGLLPRDVTCSVILFIRRQTEWLDSYFNQHVKTHEIHESIHSFLGRLCISPQDSFFCPDWHAHHQTWSRAFGQCTVLLYEEERADLLRAFFLAANLEPIADLPDIEPAQVSMDLHQLAYLLQIDPETPFREFMHRRAASTEATRRLGPTRSFSLLSSACRRKLRDRFQGSNEELARALGRTECPPSLDIQTDAADYHDLRDVHPSQDYTRYKQMADELYARRTERAPEINTG